MDYETKEQRCDEGQEVYQNPHSVPTVVTMEFSDRCDELDSEVLVFDGGKPPKVIDRDVVARMKTKTLTFEVPSSGSIYFDCKGMGTGKMGCSFRLISAHPKTGGVDDPKRDRHPTVG